MVMHKIPNPSEFVDPLNINKRLLESVKLISGKRKRPKIGLALGCGGLLGIVHIGVLKILEENNIPIDYLAGSSIGAVIGAMYALNPNSKNIEEIALSLTRKDLIDLFDVTLPRFSLISGKKVKKLMEDIFENREFSDTRIPLKIVATDLETGREVIFSKGRLIDAIMASISVPGIFPPFKYKDTLLVDGGVIDPTPIDIVKDMGSDIVIGVDLSILDSVRFKNPRIPQILKRSFDILKSHLADLTINKNNKNLIILRPNIQRLKSFNFYEIEKFIQEGERIAKNSIEDIENLLIVSEKNALTEKVLNPFIKNNFAG